MTDLDDRDQILSDDQLAGLLRHYVERGKSDRTAWHDRVMEWGVAAPGDLARWHGRLIASDLLELQPGATAAATDRGPACYRATPAGRRLFNA